jgi:hypothetical protein
MPTSKFRSSNIAFTSSFSAIDAILTGSSTGKSVRGGVANGGRVESGERGFEA